MIPVLEVFGKARAAQAEIQADREKQGTSLRLNPIRNAAKEEAGRIAVRVPGAVAASRAEEGPDRHAEMNVDPDGQETVTAVQARDADNLRLVAAAAVVVTAGVQARNADHCRLEVAAVAVVTGDVQAKAVDHRPEHAAAAAVDRPEPRGVEIKAVAADRAVPDPLKAALQEARVVAGAVDAAARSSRKISGSICFNPEDPV